MDYYLHASFAWCLDGRTLYLFVCSKLVKAAVNRPMIEVQIRRVTVQRKRPFWFYIFGNLLSQPSDFDY